MSICGGGENILKSVEEFVVRFKIRNLVSLNCVKLKIFFDIDDDDDMLYSIFRWRDVVNDNEGYLDGLVRRGRGESLSGYFELKYFEDK